MILPAAKNLLQFARERMRFDKRWFFLFYLLAGIPYLILTGPFRVPDERNHFLRSYEISEFRLFAFRISGGYPGDNLPASLSRLSEALGSHDDNRIQPAQINLARSLRLLPEQREFAEFSTPAVYSPLVYVPSAVSIALGRALGAGPLALVYFARWGNLLVGAWLISLAMSYAGFARPAALIVALFPMTLFQVASVSADAMTYALSFLWIAMVMEVVVGKETGVSRKKIVCLVCLAMALSQLRPPFPFLGLLVLLMPVKRFGGKVVIPVCSAVLAASLLPAVAWNAAAVRLLVPFPEQNIDPAVQLAWVVKHPGGFWHRAKLDLMRHGLEYWEQLVGRLGWLNIRLPAWIPVGFAAVFAACVFMAPRDPPSLLWWQRIALAVVILGGVVAIELSQYLSFNPVRSAFVLGVQGRYFTPFAAVAAFALSNSLLNRPSFELFCKLVCSLFVLSAHTCAFLILARAAGKV
jgi:uncharacterized membrane protein